MKKIFFILLIATLALSCSKKLDRLPKNDVTAGQVYNTPQGYIEAAAKVYGAFALTGNKGPAGNADIKGIDEGTSDFLRLFWCAQELSTDEAVITWGDAGLQDFHNMNWSSSNPFLTGLYYRSMYQITLANDFIKHAGDADLAAKGIDGADAVNIVHFRNEARFLRAYQYWVLLDVFGNPPFVTEDFVIGSTTLPQQIGKVKLYQYIESELKDLENLLPDPAAENYGRANKAAVQALLARLYLNAEAYTGTANYNDAVAYSKKVINGGLSLIGDYRNLMRADNDKNKSEFILTINYDGNNTQNYGGTTFLTHAPVGGSMKASDFGIGGGWAGLRTTKGLVNLFPDISGNTDKRAQFWTDGQSLEISDQSKFDQGYGITKFKNIKIGTMNSPGNSFDFADVDFPIFRLAEQYLIYAEAVVRGGAGGDATTALGYINLLRGRAGATAISAGQLTTNFILDERGRELYWEGFRRTDLIRYKRFTTADYVWPWKGGVSAGKAVEDWRNIYPIPSADKNANPNLQQNPNY
ncbi:RagB/SusD family nutrient uptake outer membrane protein [Niabella sp.]|uniref:RagB/SusD family nutrient uptake outer membrane protein n=1 Tax=Niabella sp. TaxID=1962976 RepID=UPI0026368F8E|nr:RagB/SusD family nutrient uptake outer membrane protein [Niabella sp.]